MRFIIPFIFITGCSAERELFKEDPLIVIGAFGTILGAAIGASK